MENLKSILFLAVASIVINVETFAKAISENPSHPQYILLQKEMNKYSTIYQSGGWQKIILNKKYYTRQQSAPEIKQVKERLKASGDFTIDDDTPLFTNELSEAIIKVQKSFGLAETGVIDAALIKELNVPVEKRMEQLQINMERFSSRPVESGTRIIANIPEFKLHVYEGAEHIFEMAVVVGTETNKTVSFSDEMKHIVFSPYWNVPSSIAKGEILPAARRNKNYMKNNGYEYVNSGNGVTGIRQKPGKNNSLGLVKFIFPNSHNIYFHDTPAKSLFKLSKRSFSHGCVRLAEPAKLAEYLLRNKPGWDAAKIKAAMNAGKEQLVVLDTPVPVHITYFTAWVDHEGILNFRNDIYGHDKEAAKKLVKVAQL